MLKERSLPQGAVIQLNLESVVKQVSLRARNDYKIEFSALGFTPSVELNPCKDLEGHEGKGGIF